MHRLTRLTLLSCSLLLGNAQAADIDVGVSIGISQPGVYGRIDIGRFPQPQVIVAQPVLVRPAPRPMEPVYLWVPPGHQKNWRKHCHRYQACGAPVYFVQESWYQDHVMRDHRKGGKHGDKHRGKGHGRDKHDRD